VINSVKHYRFNPVDLAVRQRRPGISAFVRVRNGETFLAESVCSHLPFFDEVVIVFNQCTDRSPEIAEQLQARHPNKVRVFHYEDRVLPLGDPAYAEMAMNAPESMANYSNFALACTRFTVATKLDDDHIAIPDRVEQIAQQLKQRGFRLGDEMLCVSGFNLFKDASGLGVLAAAPLVGNGDHGYFEVSERTFFHNSMRHEVFTHRHLRRRYVDVTYLHGKYLKPGFGFGNYDLDRLPHSRVARKRARFEKDQRVEPLSAVLQRYKNWPSWPGLARLMPSKWGIRWERACKLADQGIGIDVDRVMEQAHHRARGP
jgi:glycosyltransferase involved in cell wall biosynthesis